MCGIAFLVGVNDKIAHYYSIAPAFRSGNDKQNIQALIKINTAKVC